MTKVIYLHGFASGPSSKKATAFRNKFYEMGVSLEVPDLEGGDFENMTLTSQMNLFSHCIEPFQNRNICVIGSSMGAYLAVLAAQNNLNIQALYLMAPGFNFLNRWMQKLSLVQENEDLWKPIVPIFHYKYGLTKYINTHLFKDALIWNKTPLKRNLPTRIVHGIFDEVVPIDESRKFTKNHPYCSLKELNADHGLLTQIDWIVEDCITYFKNLKFLKK